MRSYSYILTVASTVVTPVKCSYYTPLTGSPWGSTATARASQSGAADAVLTFSAVTLGDDTLAAITDGRVVLTKGPLALNPAGTKTVSGGTTSVTDLDLQNKDCTLDITASGTAVHDFVLSANNRKNGDSVLINLETVSSGTPTIRVLADDATTVLQSMTLAGSQVRYTLTNDAWLEREESTPANPATVVYSIVVPLGIIATTGATAVTISVPRTGTLVAARLSAKDVLAAHDTNYLTFALTNKGQAGAGSTAMLSATASGTTKITGGTAIAAYTSRALPLHATPGNAALVANDTLELTVTASGTLANTVTETTVRLDYTVS